MAKRKKVKKEAKKCFHKTRASRDIKKNINQAKEVYHYLLEQKGLLTGIENRLNDAKLILRGLRQQEARSKAAYYEGRGNI